MTKIEEILEKLKQLSNEGKITWRPTVNRSTFSAVFGDSSALISKGGFIYTLRLLNEGEIGRIDSDALIRMETHSHATLRVRPAASPERRRGTKRPSRTEPALARAAPSTQDHEQQNKGLFADCTLEEHERRIARLREEMDREGVDGLYLTQETNVRYASAMLDVAWVIHAYFYTVFIPRDDTLPLALFVPNGGQIRRRQAGSTRSFAGTSRPASTWAGSATP